jgi:hypothetical protein
VQSGRTQHMRSDQLDQWRQARRARADPVGHGRDVELDALSGKALALAIERLMMAVFGIKDNRQQAGTGAAAGNGVEGCRRLGDLFAVATGELLTDRLHHLPLPGHHL